MTTYGKIYCLYDWDDIAECVRPYLYFEDEDEAYGVLESMFKSDQDRYNEIADVDYCASHAELHRGEIVAIAPDSEITLAYIDDIVYKKKDRNTGRYRRWDSE